jgi:hypothetical protein
LTPTSVPNTFIRVLRLFRSIPRTPGDCARRYRNFAQSERLIESCEQCNEEGAEIPFDNILDRISGSDPNVTDYILEAPAKAFPALRNSSNRKG